MDKFRYLVMKVSKDVCPDQKSFIEAQLTDFVSQFRIPNHPPYAAMIHKAIQELNQKGGSSKESISQYIKQQHIDLPLAHNLLLKHHLGKLCNSGEIVATRKHLYELAGAEPTEPTLGTCVTHEKEKLKKKKRGSKKGHDRLCKKDEESDKYAPCGQVMGEHDTCNKEKEDLIGEDMEMNEYKADRVGELNRVVKRTKREETGEIVKQSQSQPDIQPPPAISEPPAISQPVVDSNVKVNYLENPNQPQILNPERPPGFEFVLFRSDFQDQFQMLADSGRQSRTPQHADEQLRRGQVNCENSECPRSAPSLIFPELSPLQQQQQQLELSNSKGLQGVKSKDVNFVKQNQQPIKQYRRRTHLKSQTEETKTQDLGKSEQILAKKHSGFLDLGKSESSHAKSQQQFEFCGEKQAPGSELSQQFEFCEENKKPEFEFCGEKQAPGSELSQQQFEFCEENKKPQFEFCREKQAPESELSHQQFEFCEENKKPEFEFCREKQAPESELNNSHMNPNMWHKEKQHCKSGLRRAIKQQATTKVGQMLRRSPRLSKPKETCTSFSDVLSSLRLQVGTVEIQSHDIPQQVEESPQLNMDINFVTLTQKLQQLHLCAEDYPQIEKKTVTKSLELASAQMQVDESAKVLVLQQAKLSSGEKWCASHEDMQTGCLSLSLALEQKVVQVQQENMRSEIHQQLEPLKELSTQLQSHQQLEPLKELSTQLQSQEKSSAVQYPGQNRPKLGCGTVDMQPMMWDNQKHTSRRGRGRPPKIKSAEVNSNNTNNSRNNNQHTVALTQNMT